MPALRSLVLRLETLVITEYTHSEHNDWQEPGGVQLTVSETSTPQPAMDAPVQEEGQTSAKGTRAEDVQAVNKKPDAEHASDEGQVAQAQEPVASPVVAEQEVQETMPAETAVPLETNVVIE